MRSKKKDLEGAKPSPFAMDEIKKKIDKWKDAMESFPSVPFQVGARTTNTQKKQKSKLMKSNKKAIEEYRKHFRKRTGSNRDGSKKGKKTEKPTQLQDVFGIQLDDDDKDFVPPIYEKSKEDIDLINTALERSLLSEDMTPGQLDTLVKAFEQVEVPQGVAIIYQGEKGDYFYIVADGEVKFEVDDKAVGEAGKGDSFGELSLLYICPRAASAYAAAEPTRLFRLHQKTFQSTLRTLTHAAEKSKRQALNFVDFFSSLDEDDLQRLANALTPRQFKKGEVLVKKGDAGDAFYILFEGELKVTNISVGSTKFDDVHLKAGNYFGERALATNEPRAADVEALTDGLVFGIHRKTFQKVLGNMSRLVMKAQDRRMLEGMPLFKPAGLSRKDFENLASLVKDIECPKGAVIFERKKNVECALYIVHDGTVELSGATRASIGPGDSFGQDLVSHDAATSEKFQATKSTIIPAHYTAKASSACVVGILTLSDCRTIFDTTKLDKNVVGSLQAGTSSPKRKDSFDLEDMKLAVPTGLGSQMTQQWLANVSNSNLRQSVRREVGLGDFERISILGEGSFGKVYLVNCELHDPSLGGKHHFALKSQLKKDPLRGDSAVAVKREIDVLGMMDHPFIVNLISHYEDEEHLYILMGVVHGGELFDVIHHQDEDGLWSSGIPEAHAKFYTMVISDTLDYIHRRGFVFRDLKPENVLIDKDGYPVLCDFGFAKYVPNKTFTLCGTPNYLAPEIIMNAGHSQAADHWSLGIVIYEMVAGENPFYYDGMKQMKLFKLICQEQMYPLPDDVSDDCYDVVDQLLEKDPKLRLGSLKGKGKDIIRQRWFDELDLTLVRQKKVPAPFKPTNATLDTLLEESESHTDLELSAASLGPGPTTPVPTSPPPPDATKVFGTAAKESLLDDSDDSDGDF